MSGTKPLTLIYASEVCGCDVLVPERWLHQPCLVNSVQRHDLVAQPSKYRMNMGHELVLRWHFSSVCALASQLHRMYLGGLV